MVRTSGSRFCAKTLLKQKAGAGWQFDRNSSRVGAMPAHGGPRFSGIARSQAV
jgi:hypothetical protein